jgi:hydroxymethylpyrimidine/phosphomethylpyrimidine kinase
MTPPVALTIGGCDSAGRCGVTADLATFAAFGVHGCCALSVVTAQDTVAVRGAWPVPGDGVVAQVEAVLGDLPVRAAKTGMLGRADVVEAVAELMRSSGVPLVVDPVLVDGGGRSLFPRAVLDAYGRHLLPLALVVTPNRDELALLVGRSLATLDDVEAAACELARRLGGPAVLATGGRLDGPHAVDVLVSAGGTARRCSTPRVTTANVAGTGDVLSAGITAGLALGHHLPEAVDTARHHVVGALAAARSWRLGAGRGPLDLTHRARPRPASE